MAMQAFWVCLTLSLILLLISELTQVYRQKIHIKELYRATGLNESFKELLRKESILKAGVSALEVRIEGFDNEPFISFDDLLTKLASELKGTDESEKLKQVRAEIKLRLKKGIAVKCGLSNSQDNKKAVALVSEAFNCKVEHSLQKLKSNNIGRIVAEIRNAYDIINLNALAVYAEISKEYLTLRIREAELGAILHERREREKEVQRELREEMREEERVSREQERLAREAKLEENQKEEMLKMAKALVEQATEAERAIHEERVRQLEAEVDAAKAKTNKISMAQLTRVGTVYVISNIGSFGERVLKIGMTRRLNALERVEELSSASVPFEFDVHALIQCEDAPGLENQLHSILNSKRVNKVNLRKEFFEVSVSEVKSILGDLGYTPNFTMKAEARHYRESLLLSAKVPDLNIKVAELS